jgi:capsular polysaccharide biosynthesis protein
LSDESKFRDEEIREHLRQTQSKRKNVDYDRVKLMRDLKTLAELGRESEFETKLTEAGIVRGSPQWKAAKRAYEAFRQSR